MVGRAVAWSLGVHAAALVVVAAVLAAPAAKLDLFPVTVTSADVAAAVIDVAPEKEREPEPQERRAGPLALTERSDAATARAQPYDAVRGYQLQRIATGRVRQSREQVRATPQPGNTPWLASRRGDGHARYEAAREPARTVVAEAAEPGFARPALQEGPAATDAARPSDEVSDNVDRPLVSDEKQPQPIELSRADSAGAEGTSPTAAATAYQRAYDLYLMGVRQKVDPLWEFPRELALRMEQGDVLVSFTIRKDGRVKEVRVLKGSGFDKFDKNVVSAIKKASPFAPLPETLGAELHVTAPFEGSNPAIR